MESDELLFNLSCLEDYERIVSGDFIYYINSNDIGGTEADFAIWRISKDGKMNVRIQKSNTHIKYLLGIDAEQKWIYFVGTPESKQQFSWIPCTLRQLTGFDNCFMKMNTHGMLERNMTANEKDQYNDIISALEVNEYDDE